MQMFPLSFKSNSNKMKPTKNERKKNKTNFLINAESIEEKTNQNYCSFRFNTFI